MELESLIEESFRLSDGQKAGLQKLGLKTIRDLLFYLPSRYGDAAEVKHISELQERELAVISGRVVKNEIKKSHRQKIPMAEVTIEDDTGKIKAVWFHQPYMAKKVAEGNLAKVTGVVAARNGTLYIANGNIEEVKELELAHKNSLFASGTITRTPIYAEAIGITSNWFHHQIQKVIKSGACEKLEDSIPKEILDKYHLPSLKTALIWIHCPQSDSNALAARKRFAFEEVFLIQLERQKTRLEYKSNPTYKIGINKEEIRNFTERFGFPLTNAQTKSIDQILKDISSDKPMTRLLEGDVGSGKTAVAATVAYAVVSDAELRRPAISEVLGSPSSRLAGLGQTSEIAGRLRSSWRNPLQVAYMAPTEILAKQHFESFIKYFSPRAGVGVAPINLGLVTGSGCFKFPSKTDPAKPTNISRSQLLKWVANGEIPILIGTHSLIQKSVKFKNLALVVIDEQHRFGVEQRSKLITKSTHYSLPTTHSAVPHLLSMTATPIPRTLALTIYGDLDLTLLDEMPTGRKLVITEVVHQSDRAKIYQEIRQRISAGRQAYVICPRIDEPDPTKELAINAKSVKEEAKRLKRDIFQDTEIGVVHSKLNPKAKEKVMRDFTEGKIKILVSTSVIEVGVNVPNATTIVIEGAERFGLAQLHQLRGRVIRSNHQAYCYVFTGSTNETSLKRLSALRQAKNGFELAELDMMQRGIGELGGKKQWGISDIGMEAIKNLKMVEAARTEAAEILKKDSELKNYPLIKERLAARHKQIHFE